MATSTGKVARESALPLFCFLGFNDMKRTKAGMLLLNCIVLEALKRCCRGVLVRMPEAPHKGDRNGHKFTLPLLIFFYVHRSRSSR